MYLHTYIYTHVSICICICICRCRCRCRCICIYIIYLCIFIRVCIHGHTLRAPQCSLQGVAKTDHRQHHRKHHRKRDPRRSSDVRLLLFRFCSGWRFEVVAWGFRARVSIWCLFSELVSFFVVVSVAFYGARLCGLLWFSGSYLASWRLRRLVLHPIH